jgi:hypothetical protein
MGDHQDSQPAIEVFVRPTLEPAARRAVQEEDREAVAIAPERVGKLPSVGSLDREERLADGEP